MKGSLQDNTFVAVEGCGLVWLQKLKRCVCRRTSVRRWNHSPVRTSPKNSLLRPGCDRERLIKENAILEEKRKQQYVKLCDMDKLLRKRDNIQRGLEEIGWRMSDVVHTCRTVSEVVNEWTAQDTSNKDA